MFNAREVVVVVVEGKKLSKISELVLELVENKNVGVGADVA